MLTRSVRFSKLLASKRPLWTGWTRSSSSLEEATTSVERSPAAPGGGRTFVVPEKHFEEDDPLPVSFEVNKIQIMGFIFVNLTLSLYTILRFRM